jgi:hypothetical protein
MYIYVYMYIYIYVCVCDVCIYMCDVYIYSRTIYNTKQNCWLIENHKTFATVEGRNHAAIVVTHNQIDALLIKQISYKDMVVLELIICNVKII